MSGIPSSWNDHHEPIGLRRSHHHLDPPGLYGLLRAWPQLISASIDRFKYRDMPQLSWSPTALPPQIGFRRGA